MILTEMRVFDFMLLSFNRYSSRNKLTYASTCFVVCISYIFMTDIRIKCISGVWMNRMFFSVTKIFIVGAIITKECMHLYEIYNLQYWLMKVNRQGKDRQINYSFQLKCEDLSPKLTFHIELNQQVHLVFHRQKESLICVDNNSYEIRYEEFNRKWYHFSKTDRIW